MANKPKDEEFSLTLTGFKSKAQVKAFIDWYEGQGEQDATIWFECRQQEGEIDVDFMPVDVHTKYRWDGNTLTARLKIEAPSAE
jgi:hypothetical protein